MRDIASKVIGGRLEPRLRLLYGSIGADFAGITIFVMYFGPWLIRERHASPDFVSVAFLVAGIAGMVGGVVGGRLSDHYGRRTMTLVGAGLQVAATAVMLLPVDTRIAAVLLGVVVAAQPVRGVAQRALVADMLPSDRWEKGFADYRLVINVGLFGCPLLAAALVTHSWWLAYCGACVLLALSLWWAWLTPVVPGPPRPVATAAGSPSWHEMLLNPRLVLLFAASTAAWTVINGYEILLPTVLIGGSAISPQQWGVNYALGPLLVVVFQLRVQRWSAAMPSHANLLTGPLVMGAAFLLLLVDSSAAIVALLTVVFLAGDMMWGPASENAVVRVAPEDQRGMYMGAMAASIWLGSAIAPAAGIQIQQVWGDAAVWVAMMAIGALSTVLYGLVASVRAPQNS